VVLIPPTEEGTRRLLSKSNIRSLSKTLGSSADLLHRFHKN
jgi:hypothetical protein